MGDDSPCLWFTLWSPFWRKLHGGGDFGVLALIDHDDALFLAEPESILEGFCVHGFPVGEVTLMVKGFAQLDSSVKDYDGNLERTSCAVV